MATAPVGRVGAAGVEVVLDEAAEELVGAGRGLHGGRGRSRRRCRRRRGGDLGAAAAAGREEGEEGSERPIHAGNIADAAGSVTLCSMVEVSHGDRVVFPGGPDEHRTKGDVVAYYERIAPRALPHLVERPLSMRRYPKGIGEPGFFQKNVPAHYPSSIGRFEVPRSKAAAKRHPRKAGKESPTSPSIRSSSSSSTSPTSPTRGRSSSTSRPAACRTSTDPIG